MYCDNCHRQCPENFVTCPYCSAKLDNGEKKKPVKFVKTGRFNKTVSLKTVFGILTAVASVLVVVAICIGFFTGTKPDTVVKKFTRAVSTHDENLYYSLYDEQIVSYKKDNRYYEDEETFSAFTEPLRESVAFYNDKCGEGFVADYSVVSVDYLTDEELEDLNDTLSDTYKYASLPKKAAKLRVEINVKGDKGSYKTVYDNFYCIKIGRNWYRCDDSVVGQLQ